MDLSEAYAVSAYIEDAETYPELWQASAQAFRDRLATRARLDLPYGQGGREVYDLFLPKAEPVGLAVFVHGGYWMAFDKSSWSHLAAGPLAHGWAVAMPSYTLAPDARIGQITRQVAQAINAAAGEVPGPIVLSGHSAGGHLAARMADRTLLPPEVSTRLRHVLAISPLADLRPLMRTAMNDILAIDADEAAQESPLLMTDRLEVPVTVWVGGDERPAFVDQGRQLARAWGADLQLPAGFHHFDVIAPLAEPDSKMVRCWIAGMS